MSELRYVIQHHIASHDHYDFRLEHNGVLLSWAVPKGPSFNPQDKRLAVQVEDHQMEFRNFEGTIMPGEYGAGTIMIWDEGTWTPSGDVKKGYSEGRLKFVINGQKLRGSWSLSRFKQTDGKPQKNWLLIKSNDEFSKNDAAIADLDKSIRTGRTMEQITKEEK